MPRMIKEAFVIAFLSLKIPFSMVGEEIIII
jgi:hypothetical protein